MEAIEIIDEHLLIRKTVGYDFLKNVELCDLPSVLKFLRVVQTYRTIDRLTERH